MYRQAIYLTNTTTFQEYGHCVVKAQSHDLAVSILISQFFAAKKSGCATSAREPYGSLRRLRSSLSTLLIGRGRAPLHSLFLEWPYQDAINEKLRSISNETASNRSNSPFTIPMPILFYLLTIYSWALGLYRQALRDFVLFSSEEIQSLWSNIKHVRC